jgi:hypothetical protein
MSIASSAAVATTFVLSALLLGSTALGAAPSSGSPTGAHPVQVSSTYTVYAVGCTGTAHARDWAKPGFNATSDLATFGLKGNASCLVAHASSFANATESLTVEVQNYTVPTNGSYWVNASWRIDLAFNYHLAFGGSVGYALRLDAQLIDLTSGRLVPIDLRGTHAGYANGTTFTACCSTSSLRYPHQYVRFGTPVTMRAGHRYDLVFQFTATVSVQSSGSSATTAALNLSNAHRGAELRSIGIHP